MNGFKIEVEIIADIYHAWEYYFNQINGWWPKKFFTSPKTKRFIVDTFIGGKVYEYHGEGGGLVWGDIIGVDYPHSLQIKGHLTKSFGGPAITFEQYTFKSSGSGSVVTYEMEFVGNIDKDSLHSLENGWKDILQVYFKNYCEMREK